MVLLANGEGSEGEAPRRYQPSRAIASTISTMERPKPLSVILMKASANLSVCGSKAIPFFAGFASSEKTARLER